MWTKITDCGKQLSIHAKLREVDGDQVKLYEIVEVEFDQYKLALLNTNNPVTNENLQQVLSCQQLVQHGFELQTAP